MKTKKQTIAQKIVNNTCTCDINKKTCTVHKKNKVILLWNDKKGKFEKYNLVPALRNLEPTEEYYIPFGYIGDM